MHVALISCRAWWNCAPWRHSVLVTTRLPETSTPKASLTPWFAIVWPTTSAPVGGAVAARGCACGPGLGETSTSLPRRPSYVDHRAVAGRLQLDFGRMGEHLVAHVSDHEAPCGEVRAVLCERLIVEVAGRLCLEEVALADEQVGLVGKLRERLGPLGVARIRDDLAGILDPEAVGHGGGRVLYGVRHDSGRPEVSGGALCVFVDPCLERTLGVQCTRVQRFEGGFEALFRAGWPE